MDRRPDIKSFAPKPQIWKLLAGLLKRCRRPSPRLPLSQRAAQALSSLSYLSSPAPASHCHSGRLRLCRLCLICRRQPTPPTVTAGGSGRRQPPPPTITAGGSGCRLCLICRRQPLPPTITPGGTGFVVFVLYSSSPGFVVFVLFAVASPRLLSQRAAQALSSLSHLSSPANASHYHSGRLRLCRLCPICRRQPPPPTVTAGGSGFVVFVLFAVASQRLPLSQRAAQALSSLSHLSSPAPASHYHSGRLRLCRLRPICRRQPSPFTITAGGSGFVVFVLFVVASPRLPLSRQAAQALSSLSYLPSPANASHCHSGRLRLCRLCPICRRQPPPPTMTAGGSGFVVFVLFAVASQRLPLSQRAAQALSSLSYLSSPANASHYDSGRLRLCRLRPICRRQPTPPTVTAGGSGFVVFVLFAVASPCLPLSQRVAHALSSLSYLPSPTNASHFHSGRLRLCRLCPVCRRQPSPRTITAGGSGFVVFVLLNLPSPALASHYHSGRLRLCRLCPICRR